MQATGREGFRVFPALVVLGMVILGLGQVQLLKELRKLKEVSVPTSREESTISEEKQRARFPGHGSDPYESPGATAARGGDAAIHSAAVLANLERRVNELTRALEHPAGVRPMAEYNVMNPPAQEEEAEPEIQKRGWGQEQVTGPPDTATASDARTAWAPREQDAGPEWLMVDFEKAVDVGEIRIRETYNPGAISKVTGMVNGQEIVLWEGEASGGTAPRDFVVPVNGNLQANSIVVHLDTARVAGWNEIDSVELVGKDGSRQWARSASASSSYADGTAQRGRRGLQGARAVLTE